MASLALATTGMLAFGSLLAGCAVIDQVAYKRQSATFDTRTALADSGVDAPWVPGDAGDIRVTRTTQPDAVDAAVLLTSTQALDPEMCVEVPRQSAPSYPLEDAPDAYEADTVFACGTWSVIPSADGWFGWTPNNPGEAEQSPAR